MIEFKIGDIVRWNYFKEARRGLDFTFIVTRIGVERKPGGPSFYDNYEICSADGRYSEIEYGILCENHTKIGHVPHSHDSLRFTRLFFAD